MSAEFMSKRKKQLDELTKIYQNNPEYSFKELVLFIQNGIISRYGKTPQQILQMLYNASSPKRVGVSGIGTSEISDDQAAVQVENISTTVTDNGTTSKRNIWEDIKNVIEWLVELFTRLFGNYRNPREYNPTTSDWTYKNRPMYIEGSGASKSSLATIFPVAAAGAIVLFLMKSPNGKKPARRRTTKYKFITLPHAGNLVNFDYTLILTIKIFNKMAKLKMLKLPKKPKQNASVAVKENWLRRASEVKKENARRIQANKRSAELSKKIAGFK